MMMYVCADVEDEKPMSTIAFVSPKGTAGKTTSGFLLAIALTKFCAVTIIDADPNQ
jgi:chromosome partitioning protein